jgi:hypothetical protein
MFVDRNTVHHVTAKNKYFQPAANDGGQSITSNWWFQ